MSGKAAKVWLTETQLQILEEIRRATTSPQRLIQRASVILMAFSHSLNLSIETAVGLGAKQVGIWRRRWQESFGALVAIECQESRAALRRAIEDVLADAPRAGSSGTFSGEQVAQILAVACEPPEQSGRPITAWTHRELAEEVVLRGIVPAISISQVGRYLAEAKLQPHRRKYWLNTKEKDPQVFAQQVTHVCQTYVLAPQRWIHENTYTVSVDEMPGVQALERVAQTIPMQPGQPVRIEYEYKRHGTLCLIGNWDVVAGQMIAPTIGETRTDEDFARHIQQTVQIDPAAGWVFVVDNLNTHCSESLVRYVARQQGMDENTLGQKGKNGILASMATRQAFLSEAAHRIRFVYLPKHSSWLNQIEIVFGIVNRRVIRHGNFTSLAALKERLLQFVDYFNRTFAKPFRWTYTGRPTTADTVKRPQTWKEKLVSHRQNRETLALAG